MAIYSLLLGVYSLLLALALGVSAPWWLWRMVRSGRYREGLAGRLGFVPEELRAAVAGLAAGRTVWVHAVSVGEVLAVERLIGELRAALPGWVVAVSTTTATGQKIARERLGGCPVFYFPLDFAFAVRAYLRVLRPGLMVLVESEFWPRLLVECERAGLPVAVVNARVSDRSFPRYMRLRWLWRPLLGRVRVFLAQGEESGERLRRIGAERVRVVGNLKYDLRRVTENRVAVWIQEVAEGRAVIVAGSTLPDKKVTALNEEEMVIQAWWGQLREAAVLLVLAPRHSERFGEVEATAMEFPMLKASEAFNVEKTSQPLLEYPLPLHGYTNRGLEPIGVDIVLLDTIGDLAAVYQIADVAFVGGSLVAKGGHNPLEAARFGVPVVMGPSYENFREIVEGMRAADAIRIVEPRGLGEVLAELLQEDGGMGERGRRFFEGQAGATGRTVEALMELVRGRI